MPPDERAEQIDTVCRGNLTRESVSKGRLAPCVHKQVRGREWHQRSGDGPIGSRIAGYRLHREQFRRWDRHCFRVFSQKREDVPALLFITATLVIGTNLKILLSKRCKFRVPACVSSLNGRIFAIICPTRRVRMPPDGRCARPEPGLRRQDAALPRASSVRDPRSERARHLWPQHWRRSR